MKISNQPLPVTDALNYSGQIFLNTLSQPVKAALTSCSYAKKFFQPAVTSGPT